MLVWNLVHARQNSLVIFGPMSKGTNVWKECWLEDVLKQLFAVVLSIVFFSYDTVDFDSNCEILVNTTFLDSVVAIAQAWQTQHPLLMSVSLKATHLSQRSIAFTNAVLYQCCPCISPRTYRRKRKNCWSCYMPEGEPMSELTFAFGSFL